MNTVMWMILAIVLGFCAGLAVKIWIRTKRGDLIAPNDKVEMARYETRKKLQPKGTKKKKKRKK